MADLSKDDFIIQLKEIAVLLESNPTPEKRLELLTKKFLLITEEARTDEECKLIHTALEDLCKFVFNYKDFTNENQFVMYMMHLVKNSYNPVKILEIYRGLRSKSCFKCKHGNSGVFDKTCSNCSNRSNWVAK